jgi:hypothetical protein
MPSRHLTCAEVDRLPLHKNVLGLQGENALKFVFTIRVKLLFAFGIGAT